MSHINQTERARRAWDVLHKVAVSHDTITYGKLGSAISVHHRAIRYVLGYIQDYCIAANLPPLTILVVNATGRPGAGFIAHDLDDFEHGLEVVWNHDWGSQQNPFDFAAQGESYASLVDRLVEEPSRSEDVYRMVKARGVCHILFRDAVRRAYGWTCAFTGMGYEDALEACHIVPWSMASPSERMDVRNGLLLNCFHHRLFDRGYMTIDHDYMIRYWDEEGSEDHNSIERSLTIDLHGTRMRVPRLQSHRPIADYIERHNKALDWDLAGTESN